MEKLAAMEAYLKELRAILRIVEGRSEVEGNVYLASHYDSWALELRALIGSIKFQIGELRNRA